MQTRENPYTNAGTSACKRGNVRTRGAEKSAEPPADFAKNPQANFADFSAYITAPELRGFHSSGAVLLPRSVRFPTVGKSASPGLTVNQYAIYVEEAGGMITIHNLQHHDNLEIYKKAFFIMDRYFPDEEDEDAGIGAPQ
ncbi:Importin alpha subunit (Karyopherin alpha subunit) (Serine-rich RNA polymerase I suppressor protein), partial [Ceratobasidium sp. UAMH 11750]